MTDSIHAAVEGFLEKIISDYGATDHAWLVRCAKDILSETKSLPRSDMERRSFEIVHRQLTSSDFLWSCFIKFLHLTNPEAGWPIDNLILLWKPDFDRLLFNQRSAPSPTISIWKTCGGSCRDGQPHDDLGFVVVRDESGKAVGGSVSCSRCGSTVFNRDILRLP